VGELLDSQRGPLDGLAVGVEDDDCGVALAVAFDALACLCHGLVLAALGLHGDLLLGGKLGGRSTFRRADSDGVQVEIAVLAARVGVVDESHAEAVWPRRGVEGEGEVGEVLPRDGGLAHGLAVEEQDHDGPGAARGATGRADHHAILAVGREADEIAEPSVAEEVPAAPGGRADGSDARLLGLDGQSPSDRFGRQAAQRQGYRLQDSHS